MYIYTHAHTQTNSEIKLCNQTWQPTNKKMNKQTNNQVTKQRNKKTKKQANS